MKLLLDDKIALKFMNFSTVSLHNQNWLDRLERTMKLYNSKTQTIEEFTLPDHEVTLYVCGITLTTQLTSGMHLPISPMTSSSVTSS